MRPTQLKELLQRELINEAQFDHLQNIITRKIFSAYYELRIVLYLGVMLFTAGVGILIYLNIGDLGHLLSIIALFTLTIVCFLYAFKYAPPYTNQKVKPPTPLFDYVVLLGCLLFIAALTYLEFQYHLLEYNLGSTTLVTAAFFLYAAYRFDHLGILSLAITALASYFSIAVSPQQWYRGYEFTGEHLHITALSFGAALAGCAMFLNKNKIKAHFTFTYVNFAALIFLTGALSGVFMTEPYIFYLFALYAGCGFCVYYANREKSFLFLLYAFLYGYIATTYWLFDTILSNADALWFFYFFASCGGFIYFIIRYKSYFKRAE
jgi:hypothetical protein